MNVKGGTQTWSNSPQRADFKSDGNQTISAADKEKYFDKEDVGDTLNKVADPNYVDSSKKMRTTGNNQLGKDAFMTLLLTQMKNQDPTNPLKSHEMAAQLAQFTSLEKLNNINEGIASLRKDNQPDHNFQALAFIGKTVTMDNSKIARMDENETHDLRFSIQQDAQKAAVEIKDANGNVVRTMEMKNLKAGGNALSWNGKTDEGATAPKGDYTLSVEAFGSNGKKLYVATKADGIITGVNFTAHGAQLMMGKQVIQLADVKSISDPRVAQGNPQEMAAQPPSPMLAEAMKAMGQQQGLTVKPPESGATAQAPTAAPNKPAAQQQKEQAPSHMMQIPNAHPTEAAAPAPAERPKKVEVKPEAKGNGAKRASLQKGNINDAAMQQGLVNTLNKEGAKAGMGT
jgi:flagellar basal-body rod modification protein FlgD